jgi:hypothetical protein
MNLTPSPLESNAADAVRERILIASILQNPTLELPANIRRLLDFAPTGFDDPALGRIATAIREAINTGNVPDLLAVGKHLSARHIALLSNVANDNNSLPLVLADVEAGVLIELIEAKRVIATLGEAWHEAREHPKNAASIAAHLITAIETLTVETTHKPLIDFCKPSELAAYAPPEGFNLVGDYHVQKTAPFVIGGAPGIGKSRAAVALAVAGAIGGGDWFGCNVHRQFKTMILQAENGRVRLKNEFADLNCAALDEFVRVCSPPPFGFAFERMDFCNQLRREIDKFRPDIFILDPWNRLARDDKAKDYGQAFELLQSVLPTGDDAPALGIVAHTRKPRIDERASGRALLNLLAGSYVIGSVPRAVFVMQAASDDVTDNRIVWTCCKNNDGELGTRSAWVRRNGLFVPVENFDWNAFDGDGEKRRTVCLDDLDTLFAGGKRKLTRTTAVADLMEQTDMGKTACYQALQQDGKFSEHLKEHEGLIEFHP